MTKAQKRLAELRERQSKERQRMAELSLAESLTDETRSELDRIEQGTPDLERQLRAAQTAVDAEAESATVEDRHTGGDAENRERLELRGRASLGRIFAAVVGGKRLTGADEEYRAAIECDEGEIPMDLFEREPVEQRADAVTAAPGTIGVNMQSIVPAVFNRSIAGRIGIAMPSAASGQYSIPRLTTSLTAGPKAKGDDQESTAGAFTVISAKPRRISTRLSIRAEDLAEAGVPAFEASLRQNLQLALGDAVDKQIITGNGTAPNITGLMQQLAADTDPTAAITFQTFVADMAGQLDGLWACTLKELRLVTNPAVFGKLAATFMAGEGDKTKGYSHAGTETAVDWATRALGGMWCNGRMPAGASDISKCIAVRSGMMTEPGEAAATPAVLPTWGNIAIDDRYSDSASATGHVTLHVLVGDTVLIRQPDAYREVRIKTA